MSKRRKFSAEFKREAVQMATMPGVTLREVAKDLGVGESVLGGWKRDLANPAYGRDAVPGTLGFLHSMSLQSILHTNHFA